MSRVLDVYPAQSPARQSFLRSDRSIERRVLTRFKHFCPRRRQESTWIDRRAIDEYDCYIGIYSTSSNDARPVNVTGNGGTRDTRRGKRLSRAIFGYISGHRQIRRNLGAKSRVLNTFLNAD